jgi:hypothetical protein
MIRHSFLAKARLPLSMVRLGTIFKQQKWDSIRFASFSGTSNFAESRTSSKLFSLRPPSCGILYFLDDAIFTVVSIADSQVPGLFRKHFAPYAQVD